MQDGKHNSLHMCWMRPAHKQCYGSAMRPEQKVIARWIERVRAARQWSFEEWARRAGFKHASTISRAVDPKFDSITRIDTLHQLARGAGVPSVLDFLRNQDVDAIPSEETLGEMLADIQTEIPAHMPFGEWPRIVAAALRTRLETHATLRSNTLDEGFHRGDDPEGDAQSPCPTTPGGPQ